MVAAETGRLALSRPTFVAQGEFPGQSDQAQGMLDVYSQAHKVPLVTLVSSLEFEWIF